MIEIRGWPWNCWAGGSVLILDTNGSIDADGRACFGTSEGPKIQRRFLPWLAEALGQHLKTVGNTPAYFPKHRIITFPTRQKLVDLPEPALVRRSCLRLTAMLKAHAEIRRPLYMRQPGCGLPGLGIWKKAIRPILVRHLSDEILLVLPPIGKRGPKVGP